MTEGITRTLTSGDLGGDVEGGDRDLCEEVGVVGGAKDTINAQNFRSNSVDIKKRFFPERSAERISPEALAVLGRNAPLGAAGPAARS